MISGCYGIDNFIIIMEYECDSNNEELNNNKGVGLRNIIKSYQRRPDFITNRIKCIDDNICIEVDVKELAKIKFTIKSRNCKVGNIGFWMFDRDDDGNWKL